ncbi:MAG TPA: DUF3108 domain-containing protein [Rhizobacter sp.]|nr:DUF3108 domain-containing protein [Rhizobacter sp.]
MPPSTSPQPQRRLRLTLLALAASVGMLHLAVWQGIGDSFAASAPPDRNTPSVQVRTLAPPVEAPVPVVAVAQPAPPPRPAQPTKPRAHSPETPAMPLKPEVMLVAAKLPATPDLELTPVANMAPQNIDVPVYRTTMPPAMTLNYGLRQGAFSGTGQLLWRPTASGYEARMQGKVAGFDILTWVSQGSFDAEGLAPVRYTDQRRGKAARAANFQRQAGKISFSGDAAEFPLLKGTQDRLSWMIQIAAIATADPKRLAPGARLVMYVVGARGDADVWAFQVQGTEEVSVGDTRVQTIKLQREPRKPHDTKVEAWLAPSLHYLPAKARLSSDDSALDLSLQSAQPAS